MSLIVVTYKADMNKLFVTINSILAQKDVGFEIIITNDGKDEWDENTIQQYLQLKNFHNYTITSLDENKGTTWNCWNGLMFCKGKYVMTLSPGDYLNGENVLRKWIDNIEENKAVVSFSDCIHYQYQNGKVEPISVKMHPQTVSQYYGGYWSYNYLVFNDLVTGACMLTETYTFVSYINEILDKVKYAEDNVYRMMAFNEEKACYYNEDAILYEHGTGISTQNNREWNNRLSKDWDATDNILLSWECKNTRLYDNFKRVVESRKIQSRVNQKFRRLLIHGYIKYALRNKLHPRMSKLKVDNLYVERIHKGILSEKR